MGVGFSTFLSNFNDSKDLSAIHLSAGDISEHSVMEIIPNTPDFSLGNNGLVRDETFISSADFSFTISLLNDFLLGTEYDHNGVVSCTFSLSAVGISETNIFNPRIEMNGNQIAADSTSVAVGSSTNENTLIANFSSISLTGDASSKTTFQLLYTMGGDDLTNLYHAGDLAFTIRGEVN